MDFRTHQATDKVYGETTAERLWLRAQDGGVCGGGECQVQTASQQRQTGLMIRGGGLGPLSQVPTTGKRSAVMPQSREGGACVHGRPSSSALSVSV